MMAENETGMEVAEAIAADLVVDAEADAAVAAVEQLIAPSAQDVIPGSTLDKLRAKKRAAQAAGTAPAVFTQPAPKPTSGKGKGTPASTAKRAGPNLEEDATEYPDTSTVLASGTLTRAQLSGLPVVKSVGRQRKESSETRIAKERTPRVYVSDGYRPLIEQYEADGTLTVTEPERRDFGPLVKMNGDQLRLARPAVAKWSQLLDDCSNSKRNVHLPAAQASARDYRDRAKAILVYIDDRIAELGSGKKQAASV